jgi:thymidylate synthase (FAD)
LKVTAKLVALTQPTIAVPASTPEALVAYCARVSNPSNQDNPAVTRLFDYCIRNKHWSIFQMVNAVVEMEAPRDITRQFTRHGSLFVIEHDGTMKEEIGFDQDQGGIQEFSQRYSDEIEFTDRDFRRQDDKNRQNSIDDIEDQSSYKGLVEGIINETQAEYKNLIQQGVAKECARVILPEGLTMSRLYVNGTLRSWLHYLEVRDDPGVTQWEHVLLAREIKSALAPAFPTVFGMMDNK